MAQTEARTGPSTSMRPLLIGSVMAAVAIIAATVSLAGPWLGEDPKWQIVDVVSPTADLLAVALLARRAVLSATRAARRSWFLLAAGWSLFLVGDAMWSYTDFFTDLRYPPHSDVPYVAGTILCLVGLVLFPVAGSRGVSRTRLLLDALVVASAVTLISFMVAIREIFTSLGAGFTAAANGFYPIADLLVVLVVLLLLMRSAARRLDLALIGAGFACLVVADLSFAVDLLQQDEVVTAVTSDPPYLWAPMLLALAALAPPHDPLAGKRRRRQGALLPDLAVLAALATIAVQGIDGWGAGSLTLLTMALAVARQVWLASENQGLHRDLEARVVRRTAEVEGLAQRQRRILESVGEGIVGVDAHGRVSFANRTAEELLDAEPGSLVGGDACALLRGSDRSSGPECPWTQAVADDRPVTTTDLDFVRADGSHFPVDLTAAPHQDVTDPSVSVVVFRDITDRKATEKLKSEFVSIVSHELRTPLTSIRGSLDLLADGDLGELDPGVARVVEVARRGSERLTRLINDILVMERLETGSLPMRLAPQPAVALTESAVGALAPIAGVEHIELQVDAAPCTLLVDADRYAQVITNLVGNAVKFSPRGGTVRVGLTASEQMATISVTDTGRGIPPEELEAVFERFHQVDAGDRNVGAGTGLGLAISRSIVQAHGGAIWVESEPGVGSTFRFTVPLETAPAAPPSDAGSADEPLPARVGRRAPTP